MTPIFLPSQATQASFEVEWHCLDLRYEHLRRRELKAQQRLMLSISSHGLLRPIWVIAAPPGGAQWTVIDGHARIHALRQLGKDIIRVQVCPLAADEALISLYSAGQSRPWEPFEEAMLLQELMNGHQYSQAQCARKLGKSEAWVSHRLELLADLPECIAQTIREGTLSYWVASRVLIPFARANLHHAQQFIDYLAKHRRSSRECRSFYEHYMQSSSQVRKRMIEEPALFFKAQTQSSSTTPTQQWQQQFSQIQHALHKLTTLVGALFYPQQPAAERTALEGPLHQTLLAIKQLQNTLRTLSDA